MNIIGAIDISAKCRLSNGAIICNSGMTFSAFDTRVGMRTHILHHTRMYPVCLHHFARDSGYAGFKCNHTNAYRTINIALFNGFITNNEKNSHVYVSRMANFPITTWMIYFYNITIFFKNIRTNNSFWNFNILMLTYK